MGGGGIQLLVAIGGYWGVLLAGGRVLMLRAMVTMAPREVCRDRDEAAGRVGLADSAVT